MVLPAGKEHAVLCTKCGKPIEFIVLDSKARMPVDAKKVYVRADPKGQVKAVTVIGLVGKMFDAVFAEMGEPGAIKAFVTHWPNCVNGSTRTPRVSQSEYRKKQETDRGTRGAASCKFHPHKVAIASHDSVHKKEQITLF